MLIPSASQWEPDDKFRQVILALTRAQSQQQHRLMLSLLSSNHLVLVYGCHCLVICAVWAGSNGTSPLMLPSPSHTSSTLTHCLHFMYSCPENHRIITPCYCAASVLRK